MGTSPLHMVVFDLNETHGNDFWLRQALRELGMPDEILRNAKRVTIEVDFATRRGNAVVVKGD